MLRAAARGVIPKGLRERFWQARAALQLRVERWKYGPRLLRNYLYDLSRFHTYSSARGATRTREQLAARITMEYHKLEKGMALPAPRPDFGTRTANLVRTHRQTYLNEYGEAPCCDIALQVLFQYRDFLVTANPEPRSKAVDRQIAAINGLEAPAADKEPCFHGGTLRITDPIPEVNFTAFEGFARQRHSVRQFADRPIEPELIRQAIDLARFTPSVCNRQSGRVYVFHDPERRDRVLACQNGNAGFGDTAGAVLIVAADTSCFTTVGERNQGWVDGGLFAMSLVYALHAQGLGTCFLNWSAEHDRDRQLRAAADIRPEDMVITLLAVGHMPPELDVASSARRPLEDFIRSDDSTTPATGH